MGIVIPAYARDKYLAIMATNNDKNYLTAMELAALADNQVLVISEDSLAALVTDLGMYAESPEAQAVIAEAVAIANFSRSYTP